MVEEVVAKIKLDTADLGGSLGSMAGKRGDPNAGAFKEMQKKQTKDGSKTAVAVTAGLAMWDATKKATQALVKASPALQNTIQIFGQGLRLLLKPVGDLFSIILRPFALAFLKWAVPFYRSSMKNLRTTGGKIGGVVGGVAGAIGGAAAGAGAASAIGGLAILGSAAGPVGTVVGAVVGVIVAALGVLLGINVGAKMEEWVESIKEFLGSITWEGIIESARYVFTEMVPDLVSKMGESITSFFTETIPFALGFMYESLVIFFKETVPNLWTKFKQLFVNFFTVGIPTLFTNMVQGIKDTWNGFVEFMVNIPNMIIDAFMAIKEFFTETIPGWFKSMFDGITRMWDRVSGFFSSGREARRSVGDAIISPNGDVITTDPRDYLIATRNPQMIGGGGSTYAPNITIQATINNDMDVRILAERLAEYSKDQLARRTSDFRYR